MQVTTPTSKLLIRPDSILNASVTTSRHCAETKRNFIDRYLDAINEAFNSIRVTNALQQLVSFEFAFDACVDLLKKQDKMIYFIGNGGSAGIASHMATDFLKNGQLPALCLADPSLLTCLSNDLGYENVYAHSISMVIKPQDILVAISSSGNSPNILNAVKAARKAKANVITLSGFQEDNELRHVGDYNWYFMSNVYGIVENAHQILAHSFLDYILKSI